MRSFKLLRVIQQRSTYSKPEYNCRIFLRRGHSSWVPSLPSAALGVNDGEIIQVKAGKVPSTTAGPRLDWLAKISCALEVQVIWQSGCQYVRRIVGVATNVVGLQSSAGDFVVTSALSHSRCWFSMTWSITIRNAPPCDCRKVG